MTLPLRALLCSTLLFFSFATAARAESGFILPLGVMLEAGRTGNSNMNLQDRTMTAISVEALPAYQFGDWAVGLDLQYRMHQQQTKLGDAGNTNIAGKAYWIGLGARYRLNELWSLQGAVDFTGQYDFDKQTSWVQDDHMDQPLALRLKAQYLVTPRLSLDVGGHYANWSNFHIAGEDNSESTSQWMLGVGATYLIGGFWAEEPDRLTPAPLPPPTPTVLPDTPAVSELQQIVPTDKTEKGVKIKLQGIGFAPNSSQPTPELAEQLKKVAEVFVKNPPATIRVSGYTDSSGRMTENQKLSKARAESVREALVSGRVPEAKISSEGFGPANPVADNGSAEGRAQNRRVEIETED